MTEQPFPPHDFDDVDVNTPADDPDFDADFSDDWKDED